MMFNASESVSTSHIECPECNHLVLVRLDSLGDKFCANCREKLGRVIMASPDDSDDRIAELATSVENHTIDLRGIKAHLEGLSLSRRRDFEPSHSPREFAQHGAMLTNLEQRVQQLEFTMAEISRRAVLRAE